MSDNPHIVQEFPRKVRAVENVWIPMHDGARLDGRLWLPEDAEDDPVPAILAYIPWSWSSPGLVDCYGLTDSSASWALLS